MDLKGFIIAFILVVMPVVLSSNLTAKESCPNIRTSLGSVRKRRHLAFPHGSTVSVTTSIVKTFMTHIPSGWYLVIEIELVYKLPDSEIIAASLRKKLHHRQKREVWEILQSALDERNVNGRACIVRSICEAQMHLATKGKSLVHDILRSLFTAPLHKEEFLEEMSGTYNELLEPDFCEKDNDCPFSFLKFLLDLNKEK